MHRVLATIALALVIAAATLGPTTDADAQGAESATASCDRDTRDALERRACYSTALTSAEQDLENALAGLREAARAIEAPERRRAALAAIDSADDAWRRVREHDCDLRAAMTAGDDDPTVIQIGCAIALTAERRDAIAEFGGVTLQAAAEADGVAVVAAAGDADVLDEPVASDRFRDWRAACRADAVCWAFAPIAANGDPLADDGADDAAVAHALRIERGAPGEDWRVRLVAMETPPSADTAISMAIDRLAPIEFLPERGYEAGGEGREVAFTAPLKTARLFEAMLAGLELTARFTDAEGDDHAERFSLRGLSAALGWIEERQTAPAE